ncbi:hypothetical protein GCM10007924_25240 [Sneathiella chinensis]|uniref:Uncharacterized protein n=1 Tax=Sneathiella chinensis TaxID=349750 RepID=A0ABQ5U6J4_9PROT|nr:hypothetical protein GCM10007924_25240 [Sneathiella chinensis]
MDARRFEKITDAFFMENRIPYIGENFTNKYHYNEKPFKRFSCCLLENHHFDGALRPLERPANGHGHRVGNLIRGHIPLIGEIKRGIRIEAERHPGAKPRPVAGPVRPVDQETAVRLQPCLASLRPAGLITRNKKGPAKPTLPDPCLIK